MLLTGGVASSSNLPSLVLDNCLKIDRTIYSELQVNRRLQNCSKNFSKTCDHVSYSSSIFEYCFQYAINDEELRKRRSFLAKILFRFPGVEVSKSRLHCFFYPFRIFDLCLEPVVQNWKFRFWGV